MTIPTARMLSPFLVLLSLLLAAGLIALGSHMLGCGKEGERGWVEGSLSSAVAPRPLRPWQDCKPQCVHLRGGIGLSYTCQPMRSAT